VSTPKAVGRFGDSVCNYSDVKVAFVLLSMPQKITGIHSEHDFANGALLIPA